MSATAKPRAPAAPDVLAEIRRIQQQVELGETEPLPRDVGPFLPTGAVGKGRWIAVLAAAAVGAPAFGIGSQDSGRAVGSYLGGLVIAVAAFEFGALNIKVVDRVAPQFTLAAALFSYLLTAAFFALVLSASSPRVVDGPAVAIGLGVGLTIWLSAMVLASRVRLEAP